MLRRKARWRLGRKRPEGREIVLRPSPRPRAITYDVFDRGCAALGLDPDAVLAGDVVLREMPRPPLRQARAFLEAVLENGGAYDVGAMPLDRLDALLGVVAANFVMASVALSPRPRPNAGGSAPG